MTARRTLRLPGLLTAAGVVLATGATLASPPPAEAQVLSDRIGDLVIDWPLDEPVAALRSTANAQFPESLWLSDAHWLDDNTLLVSSRVQAINLWSVAVEWWPEAAGLLLAIILLRLLVRLLRRSWGQWRLTPGQPHCRRCYYQLTGLSSPQRCPECGAVLTAQDIVYGHHAPFKALIAVATLLVALGAGYFGWGHRLPRHGWASKLFRWPSTRQMNWAIASSDTGFIVRHSIALVRIEAVDARTGAVTRRVLNRVMFKHFRDDIVEPRFAIAPGRRSALVMGRHDLLEFSIDSGSLRRTIHVIDESSPETTLRDIFLHPQGETVCAIASTRQAILVDLASGEVRPPVSLQGVPNWPDIPVASLSEPPMLASIRQATRGDFGSELELFDMCTGEALAALPATAQGDCRLAADADAVWLFHDLPAERTAQRSGSCGVATWQPGWTQFTGSARLPLNAPSALSITAEGGFALIVAPAGDGAEGLGSISRPYAPGGVHSFDTGVVDLTRGSIVADLRGSAANGEGPRLALSPQGRRLATWSIGAYLDASRAGSCTVAFFDVNPAAWGSTPPPADMDPPEHQK